MPLPEQFIARMQPLLGEQWNTFTQAYSHPLRRGLRINTGKIDAPRFLQLFPHPLTPAPFGKDCFYLDEEHKAGAHPLHHAGAYYMQEPSAACAATVLNAQPGEKILDLCAAPGGKTTQIATALGGTGLLWSNEYVAARARILAQNTQRWGVRNGVVSNKATGPLCEGLAGYFDGVLVDAPCSGEGMFRKEPTALEEWSVDNIHLCAARQGEILDNAAKAVRPGGRLVYSTCTFAPEENECVVAAFLDTHSDFTLEKVDVTWGCPAFAFDTIKTFCDVDSCTADLTYCRRIFPHQGGEGHFVALLRRQETAAIQSPPAYPMPKNDANAQAAAELYRDCFTDTPAGHFVTVGDRVRLLPPALPDCKGLGVIAAGIEVAEICRNRLEPCHGAFLAADAAHCRRLLNLSPDDPRLHAYLHGEEIPCDGDKGWTAVAVEGVVTGFGKSAGGKLKNRYPKGLRLL